MTRIRTETDVSLTLWPGDILTISEDRVCKGGEIERTIFVTDKIEKDMVINKIVTFDVEKGDFGDGVVGGIGAAFLTEEE